ncbi:nuclear factor erythroid 2-related factor 3 [Tiliqua scincoides]|uniref:nuclear factor erythroid 2-related factor 3 n=1 Tax=Tiliqua scincoides TaxID=71010 RepID=UPI0034618B80
MQQVRAAAAAPPPVPAAAAAAPSAEGRGRASPQQPETGKGLVQRAELLCSLAAAGARLRLLGGARRQPLTLPASRFPIALPCLALPWRLLLLLHARARLPRAPLHLDFCRRGNFGFGDELSSYWLREEPAQQGQGVCKPALAAPAGRCQALGTPARFLLPACSRHSQAGGPGNEAAGMTTPRRRRSPEGLLRVTLLLSLAGLRLDWELAPAASRWLSDKRDGAAAQQHLWLQEVRALGTPRFPATRVDAWLVQEGGEAPPPPPGAARGGSNSQEEAPEPPSSGRGHCPQRQSNQRGATSAAGESSQCSSEEENGDLVASHSEGQVKEDKKHEKSDQADWKKRENTDSSSLNYRSAIESSLPLESYFPLPTSLTENVLEEHLLRNLATINSSVNFPNINSTVDLTHAISHNVSLQDAMMGTDQTATVNAENNLEIQNTLSLNSSLTYSDTSLMNTTNLLGIFASDNGCRNLTNQDFFMGMDASGFDEINITSLAIEENFDPVEASSLFEEPDSDPRLSLNLDHSNSSFILTCDSDAESASCDILGAVGGCCLEYSKYCHMDYQENYDLSTESLIDVFHNHTYNQTPHQLAPSTSEHGHVWPEKSNKDRSRNIDTNRSPNHDEWRAKALRIPFSVNDIITLPVDSFNSMLSRYYLTDNQRSLIRDIRRRGKNKVAAQNCRKRKLDAIMNLEDDVCHLQAKKESLKKEKAQCNRSINLIKQKLDDLYWDIFSRLRDDQGSPVNPGQYTLCCCKNGSVLVVPRRAVKLEPKKTPQNKK